MSQFSSKYSFEVWTPSGQLIADLAGRAKTRQIVLSRNEAEEITWTLNLDEYEAYCRQINIAPTSLLVPGVTEIRVRRQSNYICGGKLVYALPQVNAASQQIQLKATGFLNLFADRYTGSTPSGTVNETFTATQATTIATELIAQSQSLTNGDYGITFGPQATVGVHDRSYSKTNIKTALQDLTNLENKTFDFKFSHDKVFSTYTSLGSTRSDIVFEYPGNIISVSGSIDATSIHNEVIGLGQGGGVYAQAQAFADDNSSQSTFKLKQYVLLSNGTDNTDNGITDAVNSHLATYSQPLQVPALTVDGNKAPYFGDYGIGDRILIKVNGYSTLASLNGRYRLEKATVMIDDDDNEQVILQVTA